MSPAPERTERRFPRPARLLTSAQFARVFSRPERSGDRAFTLLARVNECGHARLGLAISRKCAKRAVDRQRLKRLIRESFRHHQHGLPCIDIVVMCKPPAVELSNHDVFESLDKHWRRLTRQCAPSSSD
ncbi:MAG: ribonuclease P protein component [Gammaproteobacteria bacterium]